MQQIKGTVIKARLAFVEQHWGRDGVDRITAALPPEDADHLRAVLSVKWYPLGLGERLDDSIVQVLGGGDQGVFERLGEASADANLATLHRSFLTPGRPHAFLGKAQHIYQLYYEVGRRTYEQSGERSGTLTTFDAETFSAPDCLTVIGWYRRALEMCGASGVRIRHPECRARGGEVCRYELDWEAVAPA